MATYATLTVPVLDIIGADFNASRASVWIEPNVPLVLADSIRVGGRREQVVNGVATFANLVTTNSADNPASFGYRVMITAPPKGAAGRKDIVNLTTADFPFTATANLKNIPEAWDNIVLPVEWRSAFRDEMEALRDETATISGLTGEDAAVALLVEDSGSATAGALSATYVSVNEEPLNIARTAALDGTTDDTAAWNAAIATINAASGKVQIRHPGGVSRIASASRLTPITNVNASIVGDQGTIATVKFSHANGGIDVGDGSSFAYLTQLRNLIIDGGGVATLPLRLRKSEEAHFENVRVQNHPAVAMEFSDTSLFTSARLQIAAGGTVGVKMTGACGSLTFHEANVYDTDEPFQIAAASIGRLLIADSWIETCPDVVTFNRPGNSISAGMIHLHDLYVVSTLTNARLLRAVASTSINAEARVQDSRVVADSATSPLVDFTAVDNSAATARVRLADLSLSMAALSGDLVKVHANQAWYLFHVDMERITGVTTDKWIESWLATGGVWPSPWRLHGVGTPEAVVTAPVGATFQRADGGAGSSFYVKESGTGNTGWVAK